MDWYSVWVGGGEVNDLRLPYNQALALAEEYLANGYTDVAVEKLGTNNA